jgi:heme/copper-type cytochrome/quinol oxidase subunit 4
VKSHLVNLILFAALTSTVFATLMRDEPKERLRFGAIAVGAFVGGALLVGWLMYPFPG